MKKLATLISTIGLLLNLVFSQPSLAAPGKPPLATPSISSVDWIPGNTTSLIVNFNPVANANSYRLRLYSDSTGSILRTINSFISGSQVTSLSTNFNYKFSIQAVASSSSSFSDSEISSLFGPKRAPAASPPGFPNGNEVESVRVNLGDIATFSINATEPDEGELTYQWEVDSGSGFTVIPGATNYTYTISPVLSAQIGNRYRVNVSNSLNGTVASVTTAAGELLQKSSVKTLSSLLASPGNLTPVFSPNTYSYNLSITSSVSSITLNPTTTDSYSSASIVGSGSLTIPVQTNSNSQVITVRVTAEDGSTSDYQITVKRIINTKSATALTPQATPSPSANKSTNQIIRTTPINISPSRGAKVGATVVVTGRGFTGVSAITLNGTNVSSFTPVSDSRISFVIPAGAQTGLVSIVTPAGTITSATKYTILP